MSSPPQYSAFYLSLLHAVSSLAQVFLEAQQWTSPTAFHDLQLNEYQTSESYSKTLSPGTNSDNFEMRKFHSEYKICAIQFLILRRMFLQQTACITDVSLYV